MGGCDHRMGHQRLECFSRQAKCDSLQGYFTNDDILKQAGTVMDILENHFPDEDHILVFDNATTHLKRADDALSAGPENA